MNQNIGREKILYIVQDDVHNHPQWVADQVFGFLGLESFALSEPAQQIVNSAEAPRNRWAALALSKTATCLRSLRMHRVAEFGKRLGLKRFFRGGDPVAPLTNRQFDRLLVEYDEDIVWLEDRLDRKFDQWRSYPNS